MQKKGKQKHAYTERRREREKNQHEFRLRCVEIHLKLITAIQQSLKTCKPSVSRMVCTCANMLCEMYLCESMTRQPNKQKAHEYKLLIQPSTL